MAIDAAVRDRAAAVDPPLPRYYQIYLILRKDLVEGHYAPDVAMPNELKLAARFGVSRVTLRAALNRLEQEGLIVRRRGRGTFARPQPPRSAPKANIRGVLENLIGMGLLRTTVRVLEFETIAPAADVARALRLAGAERVVKVVRVRSYRGTPLGLVTTFVPEPIARRIAKRGLQSEPMLALLEKAGVKVGSADQTVSATLADAAVAPFLGVATSSPLLSVQRVVYDDQGMPVQLLRAMYRPDRYEYQMHLSRVGEETRIWVNAEERD